MFNNKLDLNNDFFNKGQKNKSTREGFGVGVLRAAKSDSDVLVLCADLADSTRLEDFIKEFPDRFIEAGIAEQNMTGIAAGLAICGKIPFMTSFATFSPGRNWEQIRVSVCLSNTNVKISSTHAGLSPSQDGPTAQALEDIAITRVLPNMTVINPIDYEQAIKAVIESAKYKGPVYIRLMRNPTSEITTEFTPFEIGRSLTLVEGKDLSIFTTGTITDNVLKAVHKLKERSMIHPEVIAFPTIKPLDEKAIIGSAKKTRKVITVEEHQIHGGFGSAVSEVLSQHFPTMMRIIGVDDTFSVSGEYEELLEKHDLSVNKIESSIKDFMKQMYKVPL